MASSTEEREDASSQSAPSLHPELRARLHALAKDEPPVAEVAKENKSSVKKAKGGLDSDVDSLLQQLEALDSRSQALQREDRKDHARWRKDDQAEAKGKTEAVAAKGKETPIAAAALRHPLQAVELVPGGDRDIRLRSQKKRSDPRTAPFPSGSVVSLPPLKGSASAPCLVSGPFLRERHLSKA
ncbi:unnamed protein product [Symbiodinium sp. CCMP2456]|nr:unnamed protein product [Symbiodinium sp. CCMP2456]